MFLRASQLHVKFEVIILLRKKTTVVFAPNVTKKSLIVINKRRSVKESVVFGVDGFFYCKFNVIIGYIALIYSNIKSGKENCYLWKNSISTTIYAVARAAISM